MNLQAKEIGVGQGRSMARIVICDDDEQVGRFFQQVLRSHEYEVEMVHTAATCLAACAQAWPHLLVTDLNLPDMDGCELIRQMRSARPTLPILAISGASDDVLQAAQQCGADRVIRKPVTPAVLRAAAADLLTLHTGTP